MKTLKEQDKLGAFNGDVYLIAYKALRRELGYMQKIEDDVEFEIYRTPKGDIKVSSDETSNPDYKIKCILKDEIFIMYAKFI